MPSHTFRIQSPENQLLIPMPDGKSGNRIRVMVPLCHHHSVLSVLLEGSCIPIFINLTIVTVISGNEFHDEKLIKNGEKNLEI